MRSVALLFAVVYLLNIIPAFAPPTWMVLALFGMNLTGKSILLLALVGAGAATLGRLSLAKLSTAIIRRKIVSERTRQNIDVIKTSLEHRRTLTASTFLLYALSPLPSNYLFIAYGLTTLDLRLIALPFFVGRCVSYALLVFSTSAARRHLILESTEAEPYFGLYFVVSQVFLLLLVYVFAKIDWRLLLEQRRFRWVNSIEGPRQRLVD